MSSEDNEYKERLAWLNRILGEYFTNDVSYLIEDNLEVTVEMGEGVAYFEYRERRQTYKVYSINAKNRSAARHELWDIINGVIKAKVYERPEGKETKKRKVKLFWRRLPIYTVLDDGSTHASARFVVVHNE